MDAHCTALHVLVHSGGSLAEERPVTECLGTAYAVGPEQFRHSENQ